MPVSAVVLRLGDAIRRSGEPLPHSDSDRHAGGMSKIIPWVLLVAGLVVAGFAAVSGVTSFVSALQPQAQWQTPGSETTALTAGNWVIFQQANARPGKGTGTDEFGAQEPTARIAPAGGAVGDAREPGLIDWKALSVVGPNGKVATACVYCTGTETLTLGSTRYVGVARFTAEVDGDYTVTTETPGADLAIAPPALQTVGRTFGSLALMGLGLALAAAGAIWLLVLLIIYLTRPTPPATP